MLSRHGLSLYRCLVLVCVLFSSLLYIHYLDPGDSDICGVASGCEAVRGSGFTYFGVPYLNVPLIGMVAYGVLLLDSLGPLTRARAQRIRLLAGVGGVIALLLVIAQAAVIRAFCWACLVVDGSAVLAGFVGVLIAASLDRQENPLRAWSWGLLLTLVVGLPPVWHAIKPEAEVPGPVAALYVPGKINVIEFADFQCPHCRRLHPTLSALLAEYGDRVNFRRMNMPLPHHTLALDAAKAAVCAEAQGKGSQMADLLFEGHLETEHFAGYVSQLGLDGAAFERCQKAAATEALIEEDIQRFRDSGLRGLPTTFVGSTRIGGARPVEVFREAFEQAARSDGQFALSGGPFLAGAFALALGVVVLGRRGAARTRSGVRPPEPPAA